MTILVNDMVHQAVESALFEGLDIRPLTKKLVYSLLLDLPLTPAVLNDFGVETANHYRALWAAIFKEDGIVTVFKALGEAYDGDDMQREMQKRIMELDQALGNGPALTALVKKYAPEYSANIFKTPWDVIAEGLTEEGKRRLGR